MPTLFFIHTVVSLAPRFKALAADALPGWRTLAMVDESLLQNTIEHGSLSPKTIERLTTHIFSAVDGGPHAIVVTCSTLGGAVDGLRPRVSVPLFRIDRGMAETAVRQAGRIGVLATLPTTLQPTTALIRGSAAEAGRDCEIVEHLCAGAFQRLTAGDAAGHDALVVAGFEMLARSVDLVVCAQASMASALERHDTTIPYLASPELGLAHIARQLRPH
jgi:aspartate/glutamate racemase